jgi:uncharacterized protein YkwD
VRRASLWRGLAALALLGTGMALAQAPLPAGPQPSAAPAAPAEGQAARPAGRPSEIVAEIAADAVADPAALRRDLLAGLNRERAAAGVRPLAASPELDRVAQERADEMARRGALPSEEEAFRLFSRVQSQMVRAGYTAHGWTESITVSDGTPEEVLDFWREGESAREALGADYQDVGVGLASLDGVPLYTFLFAWPEREYYGRQTAKIADLAAVRAAILEAVNAARRDARLRPLTLDPRLNAAAQQHAEDMRDRHFYGHQTPEGRQPRQRVQAAGYPVQSVGENIAEGQFTVDEVMNGWLQSPDHRKNILEPRFSHLGVGLAIGDYQDRYRLVWVQNFGAPGDTLLQP